MVKKLGVDGIHQAFLSYDVDGSGSITRDELKERGIRNRTEKQFFALKAANIPANGAI